MLNEIRTGITWSPLFVVRYLMCRFEYTCCLSGFSCYFSLQNLTVQQVFYTPCCILWNDIRDPEFDVMELPNFKSRVNSSLLARATLSLCAAYNFLFLVPSVCWFCGAWDWTDHCPSLALPTSFFVHYNIIYHDFLPSPRMGSHVKSDKTHTQSSRYTS